MDLASGTLFLAMSMMLATFVIGPGSDENGREVKPSCELTPGVIRYAFYIRPALSILIEN